ncbi:MAG: CpsB/CapC family capsule biosynthesis tyrosine phosphatase [Lachnospiraceae bacterium]
MEGYIDMHCHILPAIDDGSRDVPTSIKMMETSVEQGVGYMVATPHFYATRDRIDDFLKRRNKAYEEVINNLPENSLKVVCGTEVAYFGGISRAKQLDRLTIDGTKTLLLELPFVKWNSSIIQEVEQLACNTEYQIVLAHLERYLMIPENKQEIQELMKMPVTVQVNAGSLLEWQKRRKVFRLLSKAERCVLGSDCHGVNHRVPNLGDGRKVLEKKFGQNFLNKMDEEAERLLLNQ